MRTRSLTLALAICHLPGAAPASSGGVPGEASRTAALASAVTARPGTAGGIALNAAGLADLDVPTLALSTQVGALDLWFARRDEGKESLARVVAGMGLSLATPLPGPWWTRTVRIGADVYMPYQHVLRIQAPERSDVPAAPLYGDRLEHIAVTLGAAVRVGEWLRLGGGVSLSPDLDAPTEVRYVPGRGESVDDNVVLHIDRELKAKAAPVAGLRLVPHPAVALGMAWRAAVVSRAYGPNDTVAGNLLVADAIDFYEFMAPEEWAFGVVGRVTEAVSVSADAVWSRWSEFRTIHNLVADPSFDDVLLMRTGVEWAPEGAWRMRGGYGFEPSPVPEQPAVTNYMDADRHVVALGVGLQWESISIDAHLRGHLMRERSFTKELDRLGDADDALEGVQIENLGFPAYAAGGGFYQAGLTLTLVGPRSDP